MPRARRAWFYLLLPEALPALLLPALPEVPDVPALPPEVPVPLPLPPEPLLPPRLLAPELPLMVCPAAPMPLEPAKWLVPAPVVSLELPDPVRLAELLPLRLPLLPLGLPLLPVPVEPLLPDPVRPLPVVEPRPPLRLLRQLLKSSENFLKRSCRQDW